MFGAHRKYVGFYHVFFSSEALMEGIMFGYRVAVVSCLFAVPAEHPSRRFSSALAHDFVCRDLPGRLLLNPLLHFGFDNIGSGGGPPKNI
jgi:hypothetical protein